MRNIPKGTTFANKQKWKLTNPVHRGQSLVVCESYGFMLAKPGVDGGICACTWDAAASLPVVHVRGDGGDDGGGLGDAPILLDAPG